jgi:hypothetical protein
MPSLKKYYLGDCTHTGGAVKRFRENRAHYPKELRDKAAARIVNAWMRCHAPGLTAKERKALAPGVKRALKL